MPPSDGGLYGVDVTLCEAHEFIRRHHRHHQPSRGGRWATACAVGGHIVGVAVIGRPVARALQDGWTLEVTRVATDGTRNACSFLYAACWRQAREHFARRLITYTLASEPGASLRGAGWRIVGEVRGRSWHCKSRPRVDRHPLQDKLRWEKTA